MTSPLKPWEINPQVNRRSESDASQPTVKFRIPPGTTKSQEDMNQRSSPPPIPSRQRNTESRGPSYGSYYGSNYGMYGSGYGGYGSGYGMGYSPYSMYNRPYGYGASSITPSTFARQAEESCQPAFNSVQSVVQAFASVATMLDSTFFAVHSSFRAVLGVADQLSTLKSHIANTLGALAIFRFIRYVFRKLMSLLRLGNSDFSFDESEAWSDATRDVAEVEGKKATKSWPVVLFFAVVLGTPWLIWKLLQTLSGDENAEDWLMGHSEHFEAEAEYDFDAENDDEISFLAGDTLRVAPKHKQPHVRGWLLATVNGRVAGLVPANHVKILGRRRGTSKKRFQEKRETLNTTNEQGRDIIDTQRNEELDKIYDNSDT